MYISDTVVFRNDQLTLPFAPQIKSPVGVFLNDTLNWIEISGTYIAHGGERYITIGNFNNPTDTFNLPNNNNNTTVVSYYFIDDVTVRDCTNDGVEEIAEQNISISPNPATNEIMLTSNQKLKTIHIYNVLGEEVLKLERIANSQKAIDISSWKAGVYFVEVETEKGIVRKKLVKQ